MRSLVLGLALLCAPLPCLAQSGTASGLLADQPAGDDKAAASHPIRLAYAAVLRKDDIEHALDDEAGIWVLLSDRPVDPLALSGGIFPQVTDLARSGAFEGLLFVVNPAARGELHIQVLSKQRHPDGQFETITLSGTELWTSLVQDAHRIKGALDRDGVVFRFDAPITEDPVLQDVAGAAALASPVAQAVIRNANAWTAGDMVAIQATTSARRWAELASMPANVRSQVMGEARKNGDLVKMKAISRVTIRARTATAKTPGGFLDLILEGGAWKLD